MLVVWPLIDVFHIGRMSKVEVESPHNLSFSGNSDYFWLTCNSEGVSKHHGNFSFPLFFFSSLCLSLCVLCLSSLPSAGAEDRACEAAWTMRITLSMQPPLSLLARVLNYFPRMPWWLLGTVCGGNCQVNLGRQMWLSCGLKWKKKKSMTRENQPKGRLVV